MLTYMAIKDFADVIKDLELRVTSRMMYLGPKCNPEHPPKRGQRGMGLQKREYVDRAS